MLVFGLTSTLFDLLTFFVLLRLFRADQASFQTTWFVVSLLTELGVVLVLRTRWAAWRSSPSPLLLWSTAAAAAAALLIPYAGPVSAMFGFTALSAQLLALALLIVTAYLAATEAVKRWFLSGRVPWHGQ
jgi:Mg2+-importing ATPase